MALEADEGRGRLRKASGSCQASVDPRMSEWGNPGDECRLSSSEYIGREKPTQGSETSQYLQEKKSIEIPPVVASEKGIA